MKSKTKKIPPWLILVILLINPINNFGNPVLITYFSELYFDSTGWKLELHKNFYDYNTILLKGCLLISLEDSAYIKSDLVLDSNCVVLTKEDLTNNLTINPFGDKITLYTKMDNELYYLDELEFGDSLEYPIPPAPKQNQSLCETYNYNWYLDNSPTLGFPNDTVGACGKLKGIIKDSLGNIIPDVRIYYDRNGTELIFSKYILTDSLGKFSFNCLSGNRLLIFTLCKNNNSSCTTLTYRYPILLPETEQYLDINVPIIVNVEKEFIKIEKFSLMQNYPNPFNPATNIGFRIADFGFVNLKIYDVLGNEVATLVSEIKQPGTYEVEFTTSCLTAGIYFYTLQVGSFRQTRKMLLLK